MQRPPAVAGLFYPDAPDDLSGAVDEYMSEADTSFDVMPPALIGPHAGYPYSGPVAGSLYGACRSCRDLPHRVVILSPSHRVPFSGCALSGADTFQTPLGDVAVDRSAQESLAGLPDVHILEAAHEQEHGIEVHLPFLQKLLPDFQIIPIVVGDASGKQIEQVLQHIWQDEDMVIVVSSDLSHYLSYDEAQTADESTARAIEELTPDGIGPTCACGYIPVQGLLRFAQSRGWQATRLDLRNSGDTAGPRDQVVGYGAWAFQEQGATS